MRLAAARAGVAAEPHALAARDRVLKGLADLREQPRAQPTVDEARSILVDDPMVDAVAPAVFGDAHLVVGRHLVIAVAGLRESLATGLINLDQPAAIPGAQHVRHHENGWMRNPQAGVALGDKRANGSDRGIRLRTRLALEDGMDVAVVPQ